MATLVPCYGNYYFDNAYGSTCLIMYYGSPNLSFLLDTLFIIVYYSLNEPYIS